MLLCVASCKEESYGPSSFALKEEIYGELEFEYGQTRELAVSQANIKVLYVKCPEGWKGNIKAGILTITAPSREEAKGAFGEVGLYARGYDDVEWILKLGVEVKEEVKEGTLASWQAVREGNGAIQALWKPGDMIRLYDDKDVDGYDVEPAVTIPSEGAAEATFSGVVSEGAVNVYAVYPSERSISCSAEGVLTGLALSDQQNAGAPVLAVARDVEGKLDFRNVYSYLTVTFEDGVIASLIVEDTDGDCTLAGEFSYDINSMTPTILKKSSVLTLLPPAGHEAFAKGTYTFACMPESLAGIKVTAVTSSGKRLEKTIEGPVTLERNAVLSLGSIKNELTAVDKSGWQILYANSELLQDFGGQKYIGADGNSMSGLADDLIDGDYASFWTYYYTSSQWWDNARSLNYIPYYFVIDLGKETVISSMKLTARQDPSKNDMGSYTDSFQYPPANVTVEFSSSITGRGVQDILNGAQSEWHSAETFDHSVLKNQKVNTVTFAQSHTARYIRLSINKFWKNAAEATPSGTGGALAELDLFGSDNSKIAKGDWKIVHAKSERCENYSSRGFANYGGWTGAARHMIDDDYVSIWAYNSNPNANAVYPTARYMPYYFVIDFGKEVEVSAFRLTNKWEKNNFADQSSFDPGPGAVTLEFANAISGRGMDDYLENGKHTPSEWTLYSESFDHTKIRKQKSMTVQLAQKVKARYCRFSINKVYRTTDVDGIAPTGGYGTSLAEIDFLEE